MDPIVIFCDGACSGNPGPGGWGAVIAIPGETVREIGGDKAHTTNNQMELTAAIESLKAITPSSRPVTVYSDSTYVLRGMTEWLKSWKGRGWKTSLGAEVQNRELWEELDRVARACGMKVEWRYVPGHQNVAGNERADRIAVAFSKGETPKLFAGALANYSIQLLPVASEPASVATRRGTPHYISLVNGVLQRHATWTQCEERVKGKAGAKYRKVSSDTQEAEVLKSWGVADK